MTTMKAMVYYGENDIRFEDRPIPTILHPSDAVIKLTKVTICGTDLGIWKGKNPEIEQQATRKQGSFNGRILGHAEYVRTPFADTSLYHLPEGLNEDVAVFLSDILPTSHEIGVQYGDVKPGDNVVIVGAGPIGMSCLLTAQFYSPANIIMVDVDDNRLEFAKTVGATHSINSAKEDAIQRVLELTDGRGVDCAIEAVGLEATWNICQHVVKEGGHIANVGVHGKSVNFELNKLWIKNLTITTGLVNANTTAMLLKTCCSGKLPLEKLATHHFKFNEFEKAYDVFKHAADEKALKVMIELN